MTDNHKPTAAAGSSTSNVHLAPTDKEGASYNLSLTQDGQQYGYTGTRNRSESDYVLLFDADKKHYVLHRLDSSFDMNLAATPWTDDAAALRTQYAQLGSPTSHPSPAISAGVSSTSTSTSTSTSRKSVNQRTRAKKPTKAPLRDPSPDKDDESSDDGLQIEYPGGPPPARKPAVFSTPVFHAPVSDAESADEDGEDGHGDLHGDADLQRQTSPHGDGSDVEIEADLEADLEAELARAIEDADNADAESDVSEEE